jgi:hypothetical protein
MQKGNQVIITVKVALCMVDRHIQIQILCNIVICIVILHFYNIFIICFISVVFTVHIQQLVKNMRIS